MNKHFNTIIRYILPFLIIALIAKMFATVAYIILPKTPLQVQQNFTVTPQYARFDFSKFVSKTAKKEQIFTTTTQSSTTIHDFVLKGLYGNGKKGFAIVAKKSSPQKTSIIAVGEMYDGYKLDSIYLKYVMFKKFNKLYKLPLEETKVVKNITYTTSALTRNFEERPKIVQRKEIQYYLKKPEEIWKNISIREKRFGGRLAGFIVTRVKKNSVFSKLGLQKGDVIVQVNNKQLRSYKDVMDIYNNISKISELSLVVLRNGEEKELVYEIN